MESITRSVMSLKHARVSDACAVASEVTVTASTTSLQYLRYLLHSLTCVNYVPVQSLYGTLYVLVSHRRSRAFPVIRALGLAHWRLYVPRCVMHGRRCCLHMHCCSYVSYSFTHPLHALDQLLSVCHVCARNYDVTGLPAADQSFTLPTWTAIYCRAWMVPLCARGWMPSIPVAVNSVRPFGFHCSFAVRKFNFWL